MSAEVSVEFRLLEIYHENRKSSSSAKPKHIFRDYFIKNQQLDVPTASRTRVPACAKTDAFALVADELYRIVDSVAPAQDHVVTDSDSDIIQRLVELLKEFGDQVNEKIQKDEELLRYLNGFSYKMFVNLASAFIRSIVPLGKQREEDNDQKIKIAWTFEMTSRLSALALQPMNRAMGFGAQYVHQQFAPWIQKHGGWENAFKTHEGDEVQ